MFLQFHDITAWIAIGNKTLETYCIERPDACHVTCWVASEPGQDFAVNWRNDRRATSMDGTIFVNNVMCNQHIMLDSTSRPDDVYNSVMVSSVHTSPFKQRNFKFPPNRTLGKENDGLDDVTYGSIRLEIWNLQVLHIMSPSTHCPTDALTYGTDYTSPAPLLDMAYAYRLGDLPHVTFTFHYAPREALMAWSIGPVEPVALKELKIVPYCYTHQRNRRQRLKEGRAESSGSGGRTTTRKQVRPRKAAGEGSRTPTTRALE